jgi:hypothetical protein
MMLPSSDNGKENASPPGTPVTSSPQRLSDIATGGGGEVHCGGLRLSTGSCDGAEEEAAPAFESRLPVSQTCATPPTHLRLPFCYHVLVSTFFLQKASAHVSHGRITGCGLVCDSFSLTRCPLSRMQQAAGIVLAAPAGGAGGEQ